METNKIQWRRIAEGEELPCDSLLMRYDGTISTLGTCGGVKAGQDAYYLPLDELKKLPKEDSEDERMIQYFKDLAPFDKADELYEKYGFSHKEAIAWLEKQGEKEKFIKKELDCIRGYRDEAIRRLHELEKQGVQSLANKVKPKFHEGEWITNGDYTWKIVEVKPLDYILQSQEGNIVDDTISHVDEQFHSFTIKDAKDGDVLVDDEGRAAIFERIEDTYGEGEPDKWCSYCYIEDGYFEENVLRPLTHYIQNTFPATKEQRDTLIKAMTDAGYTFDFEKKELKKIEPKSVAKYKEWYDFIRWFVKQRTDDYTLIPSDDDIHKWGDNILNHAKKFLDKQNVAWSEEDEKMCTKTIFALAGFMGNEDKIDWLKSLRPQTTWKPSEEQTVALDGICSYIRNKADWEISQDMVSDLYKLSEQLKKLREE